ncbi:MAG: dihydrofolate reductase [Pseudomonadota bacterium]
MNMTISSSVQLSLIVARGRNHVIGVDGDLPWRLSADLKRFKALTLGKPVIMGRATWASLPKRPLPARDNIVLSRERQFAPDGARVYADLDVALNVAQAMAVARAADEAFIIGGATLYKSALPFADRLYITEVDAAPKGDVYFPEIDDGAWTEVSNEPYPADARNDHNVRFRVLHRRGEH